MSTGNLDQARYNMVVQQVRPWDVFDDRVLETIEIIHREAFVPGAYKNLAYADTAIPLNPTEVMMHPILEGRCLQALDIQASDDVLEIGTGSGYLSACLAKLGSHVDSYEIDEQLAEQAEQNLKNQHIYNASIHQADAVSDFVSRKTYNAIAITGSMAELSDNYKQALAIGGRLFVITGAEPAMVARLLTRTDKDSWTDEILFETVIAPLRFAETVEAFSF